MIALEMKQAWSVFGRDTICRTEAQEGRNKTIYGSFIPNSPRHMNALCICRMAKY
jgi:hypothetical protein